jgi:transposase-like protein
LIIGGFTLTKFNFETKLEIVKKYLTGTNVSDLQQEYGIANHFSIFNWTDRYKKFGAKGLKVRRPGYEYDGNFKLAVLKWKKENQATYSQTALHFDISNPGTIANWKKILDESGSASLFGRHNLQNSQEKTIIDRLEQENQNLRIEIAYLKNLLPNVDNTNVYFAEKKQCDEQLLDIIKDIKKQYNSYGYRSVTKELQQRGYSVNHKRVLRIMNENNLTCKTKKHNLTISDGLL